MSENMCHLGNGVLFLIYYFSYVTVTHVYYAVGVGGQRLVMGDDDKCLSHVAAKVKEQFVQFTPVVAVEASRRLVGEHYTGAVDKCARHCGTLSLASRKLGRLMVGPCGESEVLYQLLGFGKRIGTAAASDKCRIATFSTTVNSGKS